MAQDAPDTASNGRVTNAVLGVKMDRMAKDVTAINDNLAEFETRLRLVEISNAKLATIIGGSAGAGGLIGAIVAGIVAMVR